MTLVEQFDQVMASVDARLAIRIREELERNSVQVVTGIAVEAVSESGESLRVRGSGGFEATADIVLVVAGVTPETVLAKAAGLKVGIKDAICVDRRMRTNVADVLASGDCVETWHRLLGQPTYTPPFAAPWETVRSRRMRGWVRVVSVGY